MKKKQKIKQFISFVLPFASWVIYVLQIRQALANRQISQTHILWGWFEDSTRNYIKNTGIYVCFNYLKAIKIISKRNCSGILVGICPSWMTKNLHSAQSSPSSAVHRFMAWWHWPPLFLVPVAPSKCRRVTNHTLHFSMGNFNCRLAVGRPFCGKNHRKCQTWER